MHRCFLQSFSVFCAHHTHVHLRARAPVNLGSGLGTDRMAARSTSGRTFSTTTTAPFIRKMLGNTISRSIRLAPKPPVARTDKDSTHEAIWHGRPRIDEYAWMQRPQSGHELAEYLRQETQYARNAMKGSARLQRQIAAEMRQATEVHTMPPPVETESGGFVYYVRQNAGGSTVYCRRPANARSEQVLVDGEQLARRDGYELRTLLVSDDHDCFACLAAPLHDSHKALSESSSLLVYSLGISGEVKLVETLENVFNFAFGPRNTVFYTVLDEKLRAHRVMGHRIGRPQTEDAVVFDEPDAECFVDITRTKDKRYHIVNSSTLDSSELRVFRSDCDFWQTQSCGPSHCGQIRLIRRRQKNVEYFIDHHSGEFVILTNCPKDPSSFDSVVEPLPFRLLRAPTEQPEAKDWTELLSVSDSERIEDVEVFEKHIVVSVKRQGLPAVVVYNRPLDSRAELRLPYNGNCTVRPEPSPRYNASTIRLSFSSPVHLESVAEYNLDTLDMCNSWSATPLHIDSGDFVVRQVRVPHGDVVVPMTLIHPEAAYWSQNA
ncbi:hypothetical protein IWW45_003905 [Coemansia sp. RSA 485]|nr:hypothetical protein IWW45_003905 [Coemansia sp. RSA 485]